MSEILLVEDDPGIAELLRFALEESGFALFHAPTVAAARDALAERSFSVLLLDLNLPDGSGHDLCQEIRRTSTIPILILTARRDEIDRVLGLEIGADDYIVKPFSPREVVARIRAVLRRQGWSETPSAAHRITVAGVTVDEERHEAFADGELVSLTRVEFRLLLTLARRPGRVFSRQELIDAVWTGAFIQDRVVDSVISRLRRKLGAGADGVPRIRTVHGVGYSMTTGE